ncbi:hypothetical protein [Streptomonospora wellingtoniae]|uniref:DUF4355 domain-containing protein n=1 Tax=Streptomonospora wellingtoniae TaxID=3075544 RepID=A0ABU2KUV0_9ACTN|nr:hypothetical protein [Streptomonospora sp. DSM 45055]MDT0302908.1 hypothetical protein [Streptomonospora sp. DSM 45055]
MSENESAGAPETGAEGGETTTTTSTEAPAQQRESEGGFDATPWQELAEETGLSPTQIRKRLEHARTWEQRAKDNKSAADEKQTLQQQVDELRDQMTQRDLADVERNGKLAMTQVESQLAERGIKPEDAKDLLSQIDPTRLLADGDVDTKAVKKLAESLTKVAGRATPDLDQGQRGGDGPTDMNNWIRRKSGRP